MTPDGATAETGRRRTDDGLDWQPPGVEGRATGAPARGRALLLGRLRAGGAALPAGGDDPWADAHPPAVAEALHGFGWLDDLAALGGAAARETAQRWLAGWLARYGGVRARGRGLPWRPDLAGRRLLCWSHHARFLLSGPGGRQAGPLAACALAHGAILAARWPATVPGLPRFEAAAALAHAATAPDASPTLRPAAQEALTLCCDGLIDPAGGLPGRNPEELLAVFIRLTWAQEVLVAAGLAPPAAIGAAQARMAPALKALRHADGGLARFHGGGAGPEGGLDLALAQAGVRARPRPGGAMGFARLAARRTTVIVDAGTPPDGGAAQAATLAFELTSGRRPVIAGPGPGAAFGAHWARAARATAAQATLAPEGWSSSHIGPATRDRPGAEPGFSHRPAQITLTREGEGPAAGLILSHDGWARSHGLVHVRRLALSADGRALWGEDALMALTPAQRRRFDAVAAADPLGGVGYALRFPLHPDVAASLGEDGASVRLTLRSGEVWVLKAEGALPVLEPGVHFDPAQEAPRPTAVIVLAGLATGPAQQIVWTLAKAEDTPIGLRDTDPGDGLAGD